MRKVLWQAGDKIRYVIKQTFRAHSAKEYAEIFSRGRDRRERPLPCPWLYARSFVLLLFLFTSVLCVMYFSNNRIPYPTAMAIGGLLANVPVLLLFYELYPKRDFSLVKLAAVTVFGGLASISLAEVVYIFVNPENRWLSALLAGGLEEFTKALSAVVCLLVLRKRDPMLAFLVGAAVGAGFAISEDMGYIFNYSVNFYGRYDISQIVALAVVRTGMSACTHMAWTGIIAWAWGNFRKPLINFRFYAFCLLGFAMHACWDFPLTGALQAAAIAPLTVGAIILQFAIICSARKKSAAARDDGEQIALEMFVTRRKINLSQAANAVASLCCVAVCILTLAVFYINMSERTVVKTFTDAAEYVDFMQNGAHIEYDYGRKYDQDYPDWAYYIEDGKKTQAVQRYDFDGYTVDYCYNLTESSEEGKLYDSFTRYVRLTYNGRVYTAETLTFEEQPVRFFVMNETVSSYGVTENGTMQVRLRQTYMYGVAETVVTASVAGAVALGGLAAFITLKIKARRLNNA